MTSRRWTPAEDARLRELYPFTRTSDLPALLGRTRMAIKVRAAALHLRKDPSVSMRRSWSGDQEAWLITLYPDLPTVDVAAALGRTTQATYNQAQKLGLRKSAEFLASPAAGRTNGRQGIGTRFPKGHVPMNKGMKRGRGWAPGRMREGQFRKGERSGVAVQLWQPIGTEKVRDGYLVRKINDDLPLQRRWRAVHLLLWEEANGPLPRGHVVVFRNGDPTDIRLENLECLTRRELMLRNSVHNLPAPLPQMVQLIGAINRKINRRRRTA